MPNPSGAGVVLGIKKLENGKEQIYYVGDDVCTLCIGATRSGKSRTIAAAILCVVCENKKSSEYQNLTNVYWFVAEYVQRQSADWL